MWYLADPVLYPSNIAHRACRDDNQNKETFIKQSGHLCIRMEVSVMYPHEKCIFFKQLSIFCFPLTSLLINLFQEIGYTQTTCSS